MKPTSVASLSINDTDTLWIANRYQQELNIYIIRDLKCLGKFDGTQWLPGEHDRPATPQDIFQFNNVKDLMLNIINYNLSWF